MAEVHCSEHAPYGDRTHNASVVLCPHVCGPLRTWEQLDVHFDSLIDLLSPYKDGMPHGRWEECDGMDLLYYDPSNPTADRVVSAKVAKSRLAAQAPGTSTAVDTDTKAHAHAHAPGTDLKRYEIATEDHLVDDAKDRAELERLAKEELGPALRKLLAAAQEVKAARDKVIAHLAPKVAERDRKYPNILKKIDPDGEKPKASRASKRKKTE